MVMVKVKVAAARVERSKESGVTAVRELFRETFTGVCKATA